MTFLEAIAHEEGFYAQTPDGVQNRPQKNNNPGDLIYVSETINFGAIRSDGRFAVFPDVQTGWNALKRWLSVPAKFDANGDLIGGYLGASIEQVINRFAPPFENFTIKYLNTVCEKTELKPTDILNEKILGEAIPYELRTTE